MNADLAKWAGRPEFKEKAVPQDAYAGWKTQRSYLWLGTKVEQQSNLENTCSQIVEHLSFVRWRKGPHSFQFDHHQSIYHQVRLELTHSLATKAGRHSKFSVCLKPRTAQGYPHSFPIN